MYLGSAKPREKLGNCRVKIITHWGCRNDGEMQPLPQPFGPEKFLFQIMRGFSTILCRREDVFDSPVSTYEFLGVSSVFTSQFPMPGLRDYFQNLTCLRATPLLFCPESLSRLRIKPPPSSERGGRDLQLGKAIVESAYCEA